MSFKIMALSRLVNTNLRCYNNQIFTHRLNSTSLVPREIDVPSYDADELFKTVQVEVRSGEPAVLKSYELFAKTAANHLGITIGKCWSNPVARKDRLTLLKSVHIYKKHRVQYEIRTHFTHLTFHNVTGSTADTYLEYIQRNLPEGVAMKVTKTALEALPDNMKPKELGK